MPAPPAQRIPAVILATRPLGEADLLVVLLTPDHGKLRAAGRHARKSTRRFAGGLVGGAIGEAQIVVRGGGGLARLSAFSPTRDHGGLGRDLTRFAYVAYLCELTDGLLHEPEPDPALFSDLCGSIARTMDAPPRASVLRRYELRLLWSQGLVPALDSCAVCGDELPPGPTVAFDEPRGGSLCRLHGRGAPRRAAEVLAAAARLTAAFEDEEIEAALAATESLAAVHRRALRDLTTRWLRVHIRRPLRSREFFGKLGEPQDGP